MHCILLILIYYFKTFSVNFPVVSGGFALLKVASVAAASSGIPSASVLSTALTFGPGAATSGLLGKNEKLN